MVSDNNTGQDSPQHLDTPGAVAFDAAYAAPALEELRKAVTGNGVKPENIRLENITGATLNFTAVTILKIQPRISEKTTLGRITGPEKVDNAKSMRDAIENHKRESVQNFANITRIRDTILSRDDRGFALVNARINLDFLRKDFVYFESCNACRAKGTLLCQRCDGKGYEICPRCNGNGVDFCPVCNGNGTIQMQDGKHQSCHRCRGERKIVCSLCQQRRKIQCGVCKTKGSTTCAQCNGQGWNSIISIVEIEAIVAFDYSRDDVPERIRMQIEELGAALAQYASITPIAPAQETRSEDIKITYQVSLPYADAVFAFNGKKIDALLLGNNGKICNAPNFLEDLIRPGIEKLEAAAQGRGATDSLLREASMPTPRQGKQAAARDEQNPADETEHLRKHHEGRA